MATNGHGNYTNGYRVVGTRPIRHDGVDKVTGNARFSADVNLPGLLYGRILRSPHSHAIIKSIDTSRAEAYPGVRAVTTAADLPQLSGLVEDLVEGSLHNFRFMSNNVLALDKALYKGHAIAAVAATSAQAAEQALELIDVEYEVLPPVTDAREAMKPGAPILHPRLVSMSNAALRPGGYRKEDEEGEETNVANHFEFRMGDLEQGFAEADEIVERDSRPRRRTRVTSSRMPASPASAPTARASFGAAPRAISWCATPAPACSAWTFPSCASPHRRSAAGSAARPPCSSSRWPSRFRARRAGRSRS